jgi:hypothetical protein
MRQRLPGGPAPSFDRDAGLARRASALNADHSDLVIASVVAATPGPGQPAAPDAGYRHFEARHRLPNMGSVATPDWFISTLTKQLTMNERSWEQLQCLGVTEDTAISLDFHYDGPNHQAAEQLRTFLLDETDYVVDVENKRKGLSKTWTVSGRTQPTAVSLEILNEWVRWMVAAGAEMGGCRFDGWGALAPS